MSRYIHALNTVKANIARLQLTPSQVACRSRIQERLAYPGLINLYGRSGVGKTVLSWAMAAAGEPAYLVHPSRLLPVEVRQTRVLFVDNAAPDRRSFRRLCALLESGGVDRAVVVTRAPVDDYVFRAELELTPQDVALVRQSLAELGYQATDHDSANLWDLLMHIAREG